MQRAKRVGEMSWSDGDFVMWIRNRLVNNYGESPNTDFVTRLAGIATRLGAQRIKATDSGEPPWEVLIRRAHLIDLDDDHVAVLKSNIPGGWQ